jgi:hypothetical protein
MMIIAQHHSSLLTPHFSLTFALFLCFLVEDLIVVRKVVVVPSFGGYLLLFRRRHGSYAIAKNTEIYLIDPSVYM